MARRVLVINGHPDPSGERYCTAVAAAYLRGANMAGHQIRRVDVGVLDLPPVKSPAEFTAEPCDAAKSAQDAIRWAEHVVVVYPLWLGAPPAVLKAFFEQVFRYGFAVGRPGSGKLGLLRGRTARVIVTMGMPAPIFSSMFDGAGLKCLTRGMLRLAGFRVRSTIIGGVESSVSRRRDWLRRIEALGARAG
ncbi:MAG TPA: NAD(P)H-dependent oxidoreductase [Caulobacter sp.]|nr:NAD(P)H-dependent oxidoreductase [Caulobacter sp.]